MTYKYKSPLAPKKINKIKAIAGVDLYTFSAGLYNKHRSDIALFIFNKPGSIAEVFTKSSIKSHTRFLDELIYHFKNNVKKIYRGFTYGAIHILYKLIFWVF